MGEGNIFEFLIGAAALVVLFGGAYWYTYRRRFTGTGGGSDQHSTATGR